MATSQLFGAVAIASALMLGIAHAEPASTVAAGVKMVCPATGPGIVVCTTAGTLLHEGVQAANGKKPFGPNGEGMKAARGACRLAFKKC